MEVTLKCTCGHVYVDVIPMRDGEPLHIDESVSAHTKCPKCDTCACSGCSRRMAIEPGHGEPETSDWVDD